MTPQSELEIKGNFLTHPFAELVAEIQQARLNGSLRVSGKEKKCVVYFKSGRVVFAVSNARTSRLFDILLSRNKLSKGDLARIPNYSNDVEFAAFLRDKHFLTKEECDRLFAEQIEAIIVDILSWSSGDWIFSSLTRVRDGLALDVDTTRLLVDFGRCMPVDLVLGRFRSLDESFSRSGVSEMGMGLKPEEAFILSRADDGPLTAADVISVAGMSEPAALHSIYTLWLGGLLIRNGWQPAFSDAAVSAMRNARLELKKEAILPGERVPGAQTAAPETAETPTQHPEVMSLDEYLARVESGETYYDILGVDTTADVDELKRAYFSLAKVFHPDKYHSTGGETFKRIQHAFTVLAHAHETLRNEQNREIYDYRMRKELAEREKRLAASDVVKEDSLIEEAAENFERGFNLLMDLKSGEAIPFLARAAHFAPKNARYRAYYGKALSADPSQNHKAESEMQAALKLDPNNPTFRLLIAEFFIQVNLLKRAEGELNRLLAIFPSNRDALEMLNRIQK